MQYDLDTITATNGNATIVGGANVDWSSFLTGLSYFILTQTDKWWLVVAVRRPSQNVSGRWEIDLNGPFQGAPSSAPWTTNRYILGNGFSSLLKLPLLAYGDGQGNQIFSQAMLLLDAAFGQLAANQQASKQTVTLQRSQDFVVSSQSDESYLLRASFAPFSDPRPLLSTLGYYYGGSLVYPSPSAQFNTLDSQTGKSIVGWHVHIPRFVANPGYGLPIQPQISFYARVEGWNFTGANPNSVPANWSMDRIP